eukprot:scaffold566_cov115-Isochrysis_galbana.AAC.6
MHFFGSLDVPTRPLDFHGLKVGLAGQTLRPRVPHMSHQATSTSPPSSSFSTRPSPIRISMHASSDSNSINATSPALTRPAGMMGGSSRASCTSLTARRACCRAAGG